MMVSPDDIQRELMGIFQEELADHLATLSRDLLSLEQGLSGEEEAQMLAEVFRAAHSIKGAARTVDLTDIAAIAHRMEDVFYALQHGSLGLSPALCSVLFEATDTIKQSMEEFLADRALPAGQIQDLDRRLEQYLQAPGAPLPPDEMGEIQAEIYPAGHEEQPAAEMKPGADAAPWVEAFTPGREEETPLEPGEGEFITPHRSLPHPPQPSAPVVEKTSVSVEALPNRRTGRLVMPDETVRVSTAKLDTLMNSIGELLVVRMRTEQMLARVKSLQSDTQRWQKNWRKVRPGYANARRRNSSPEALPFLEFLAHNESCLKQINTELLALAGQVTHDRDQLQLIIDDLQDGIRRVRLTPISTLFDYFPRMVRDLALSQGKEVTFLIEGTETEVDRKVLELVKDPLMHLLRNAVDHGIEMPEERVRARKQRQGTICLRAEQRGTNILLEVSDDGKGINLDAVRAAAVDRRTITPDEAQNLSEQDTYNLIFQAGLTTAQHLTDISGRGVGMDVVRRNVEKLGGFIQISSRPGAGAAFTLFFPLTLATSHILLLKAAGETLALPMNNVERMLKVPVEQIRSVDGKPALYVEERLLPLVDLAQLLGLAGGGQVVAANTKIPVVLLNVAEKHVALRVESFVGSQEVVIKNLGCQLRRVRNIAGGTILGDGSLVMVLNPVDLMKTLQMAPSVPSPVLVKQPEVRRRRILVADDSITTRTLEKHILENAGYRVLTAVNGREALELLRDMKRDPSKDLAPDLLISDVNMPEMDGFELAEAIKGDNSLRDLPVILVTSLESQEDKLRGMDAGADAYIVKSTFDQRELLETIEQLIG